MTSTDNNHHIAQNDENLRISLKRVENMRVLNKIRFGPCGRFDEHLKGVTDTNWRSHRPDEEKWPSFDDKNGRVRAKHCANPGKRRVNDCSDMVNHLERHVCEAPHPTMKHVMVTIERFGQFLGRGGNDWTSVGTMYDLGGLQMRMKGKNMAYVGGMAAPTFANGAIIGLPPLHIHHAHIIPHASHQERGEKIFGGTHDYHHIILQSHGDSECHPDEGGVACLLEVLDHGKARVVDHSETGLIADFEINDVRLIGSEELQYWSPTSG